MTKIHEMLTDPATRTTLRRWLLDASYMDPVDALGDAEALVEACEEMYRAALAEGRRAVALAVRP